MKIKNVIFRTGEEKKTYRSCNKMGIVKKKLELTQTSMKMQRV